MQETKRRQEVEMTYQNPLGFDDEPRELRLTIQGLRKFEEEDKYWKAKYVEKAEELKAEEAFYLYTQVTANKWFIKCEEVLKLINQLMHVFPKRIKRTEMRYESTTHVILHFIHFCQDIVYTLREELEYLKKVQ